MCSAHLRDLQLNLCYSNKDLWNIEKGKLSVGILFMEFADYDENHNSFILASNPLSFVFAFSTDNLIETVLKADFQKINVEFMPSLIPKLFINVIKCKFEKAFEQIMMMSIKASERRVGMLTVV